QGTTTRAPTRPCPAARNDYPVETRALVLDLVWSAMKRRRRQQSASGGSPAGVPELAASRFHPWFADLAHLSLWHMLTRLPALIATALRWSWKASPRDTLATMVLNVAAGVVSAVVLTAVVGILQGLFAEGP